MSASPTLADEDEGVDEGETLNPGWRARTAENINDWLSKWHKEIPLLKRLTYRTALILSIVVAENVLSWIICSFILVSLAKCQE
jgi:hypothetical protein